MTRLTRLVVLFCSIVGASGVGTGPVVSARPAPGLEELPSCDRFDATLWDYSQDTLGVFVTDQNQNVGGSVAATKFKNPGWGPVLNDLLGGYGPESGSKELVCGTLDKWELYRLGQYELDLHPYVTLSPRSQWVLDDQPRGKKSCGKKCLWGEVTVPQNFQWFWRNPGAPWPEGGSNECGSRDKKGVCQGKTTTFDRGKFCMYGTLINEAPHDFHPEIHPVQAFWAQAKTYASLFLVDDVSQRFDNPADFERTYLSTPFKPWSGQDLEATMYQVVRVDPALGAHLTWNDGASGNKDELLDTGAGTITINKPPSLSPKVVRTCKAGQRTQAVIETRLPFDRKAGWFALGIGGERTGIDYGHGGIATSSSQPSAEEDDVPWLVRSGTEWSSIRQPLRKDFSASNKAWGLPPGTKAWSAVLHSRIGVDIAMAERSASGKFEPPAGLVTEWTVNVQDLDSGKTVPEGVSSSISLVYDRHVPTTAKGADKHRTDHHGKFALTIQWNGESTGGGVLVGNYKATIKLTARTPSHREEREFVVYSLVPDAIALVSGYDLKKEKGAFPEQLLKLTHSLLDTQGCKIPLADLIADLKGIRPGSPDLAPLRTLLSPRRRTAGVLRQTVNAALADKTMDAAEFGLMMRAFGSYRRECSAGF